MKPAFQGSVGEEGADGQMKEERILKGKMIERKRVLKTFLFLLLAEVDAGQENAVPEFFDDGLSEGLRGYAKSDSAAIERVEHDCQGAGPKPSQQAFDIWEW